MNGDCRPDVVVDNPNSGGNFTVLANKGNGVFGDAVDFAYVTGSVAVGDLDGDRRPDVVITSSTGSGTVTVLLNTSH